MKTIHAHTETGASHPGYVNISEQDDGAITVTVRTRGGQVPSTITMDRDQLAALGADVAAFLAPAEDTKTGGKALGLGADVAAFLTPAEDTKTGGKAKG